MMMAIREIIKVYCPEGVSLGVPIEVVLQDMLGAMAVGFIQKKRKASEFVSCIEEAMKYAWEEAKKEEEENGGS